MKNYKNNYTYEIINIQINKSYIGTRSTNIKPEDDLGIIYFSSSSDKEFMQEQKEHSDRFEYRIIQNFNTRDEAVILEVQLHENYDVGRNKNYYNKSKQTSSKFGHILYGRPVSIKTRNKHRKSMKGKLVGDKNGMYGQKHSIETCELMSKNRPSYEGELNPNYGKKASKETRRKQGLNKKGKNWFHNKTGEIFLMDRNDLRIITEHLKIGRK